MALGLRGKGRLPPAGRLAGLQGAELRWVMRKVRAPAAPSSLPPDRGERGRPSSPGEVRARRGRGPQRPGRRAEVVEADQGGTRAGRCSGRPDLPAAAARAEAGEDGVGQAAVGHRALGCALALRPGFPGKPRGAGGAPPGPAHPALGCVSGRGEQGFEASGGRGAPRWAGPVSLFGQGAVPGHKLARAPPRPRELGSRL